MIEYTVTQLRYLAGIYHEDSDFVQDVKLSGWLAGSKYRVVAAEQLEPQRESAQADGVEILIIKE